MRLRQLLLLLLVMPAVCQAETEVCTVLPNTGPITITQPGTYCVMWYVENPPGSQEPVITVDQASDVTIDCNGNTVSNAVTPTAQNVDSRNDTGIYIGSSSRVTVRNCHFLNQRTGIFVGRIENGFPRSRDIVIEDNLFELNGEAIQISSEGTSRVSDNTVLHTVIEGIEAYAAPGQLTIRGNNVLRVGDPAARAGRGGYFSQLGGWMIVEGNTFAEVVGPAGTASAAVGLGPLGGVGVTFTGNRVLAPANPTEKGGVTIGIDNAPGNSCTGNLTVGYGTVAQPNCPLPANEQL